MKKIAIIGTQWGDEGKGKIVNYFSSDFDWVVRYSGGANAGHTIYFDGIQYVNHLLPSLHPRSGTKGFLGAGMVIDLGQLIEEIRVMSSKAEGFAERIYIDPEAFIVLPWHKQEDSFQEEHTSHPIGTTRRGIGPAYTDKVSRKGIKIYWLFEEDILLELLKRIYSEKQNRYGGVVLDEPDEVAKSLIAQRQELVDLGVHFTSSLDISKHLREESVLFEGAQGVLLDLDFGTYPYVTSSSCLAHGIAVTGFSLSELDEIFGVVKAYTTRVGTGPFPTEERTDITSRIREKGREYGATTGRARRVGWLDLPALRYACERSSVKALIMTKADILAGTGDVKVCRAYRIGDRITEMPASSRDFFRAEPVYETLPGWKDIRDTSFGRFVEYVEMAVKRQITYISFGPETDKVYHRNEV